MDSFCCNNDLKDGNCDGRICDQVKAEKNPALRTSFPISSSSFSNRLLVCKLFASNLPADNAKVKYKKKIVILFKRGLQKVF